MDGPLYEVALKVESYSDNGANGSATVTKNLLTIGGSTPNPSSNSTGGTSSSSSSTPTQATTCKTPLITYPPNTVPSDPYTACFKYTNNKCYVCKVENEGEFEGNVNTCVSGWVWDGSQIASNLENGYWYYEVPCPGSSSSAATTSSSSSAVDVSSSSTDQSPVLKNRIPVTYFSVQTLSDKALRIEISSPSVVEIFDLKGNKAANLNVSGSQTVKLSLPSGVYFAKVRGMKSIKFMLK